MEEIGWEMTRHPCELNRLDQEGQFFGYPYKHASNVLDPEFGHS
jgi:glucose/arabinose dehydrogenase